MKRFLPVCMVLLAVLFAWSSMLPWAWAAPMTLRGSVSQQTTLPEALTTEEPGVVGINMTIQPGVYPVITEVYRGTPAQHAGLLPGDAILAINTETTLGLSRAEVDMAISDVPGERVTFLIARQGRVFSRGVQVAAVNQLRDKPVKNLYRNLFGP